MTERLNRTELNATICNSVAIGSFLKISHTLSHLTLKLILNLKMLNDVQSFKII